MKTHLTLFAIVALFFAGTYSTIGQDDNRNQEEYAIKKRQLADAQNAKMTNAEMTPEMVAKKQILHLQQLLNLDDKQTSRVYEICSSIENEMAKIPTDIADEKKTKFVNDLEKIKNEKLRDALTADQFKIYQNSLNNEK